MKRLSLVCMGAASLLLTAGSVWAQGTGATKSSHDAYYMHAGQKHDAHAFDWARSLDRYSLSTQSVPNDLVDETVKAIRRNVLTAQMAYEKLSVAAKTNPETSKKLAGIRKEHARILELCDALESQEGKTGANAKAVCACCTQIKQHLTVARAASLEAVQSEDMVTSELNKPGRGAFSS